MSAARGKSDREIREDALAKTLPDMWCPGPTANRKPRRGAGRSGWRSVPPRTDRGTEYCGNSERHEYGLYLAVEDVDHLRSKTKSPQTNGIVERFHKSALNEFYRVAFRKKIYGSIAELQADLDAWVAEYNEVRPHQGHWCFGKTPMQTFLDAAPFAKEKMIAA